MFYDIYGNFCLHTGLVDSFLVDWGWNWICHGGYWSIVLLGHDEWDVLWMSMISLTAGTFSTRYNTILGSCTGGNSILLCKLLCGTRNLLPLDNTSLL